jgi:KaiC domain protein
MEPEEGKEGRFVYSLSELKDRAPKFFGVKTGTKLDNMFYITEYDEISKRPVKKILGGIPYLSVMNVVGIPDTGKSVFVEQFAIMQASLGYKVLIVTTENPSNFLYKSLLSRSYAMGINFDEITDNFIIIDATREDALRDNVRRLIGLMNYAMEKKKSTITIIDSITGLYEHREKEARQVVRQVFNFMKEKKQTAIFVSQKRSSQDSQTSEAAGGLGVAHIVDGTIVMDKKVLQNKYEEMFYNIPVGSLLRTIRIDGCRVAGHDIETYVMDLTDLGLVSVKEKLSESVKR